MRGVHRYTGPISLTPTVEQKLGRGGGETNEILDRDKPPKVHKMTGSRTSDESEKHHEGDYDCFHMNFICMLERSSEQ